MSSVEVKTIAKIALYGAIIAVAVNYFIDPSVKSALGIRK